MPAISADALREVPRQFAHRLRPVEAVLAQRRGAAPWRAITRPCASSRTAAVSRPPPASNSSISRARLASAVSVMALQLADQRHDERPGLRIDRNSGRPGDIDHADDATV